VRVAFRSHETHSSAASIVDSSNREHGPTTQQPDSVPSHAIPIVLLTAMMSD